MQRARLHALLGDLDAASPDLEQAFAERDGRTRFITTVPELTPLRDDPRYAALLGRMEFR